MRAELSNSRYRAAARSDDDAASLRKKAKIHLRCRQQRMLGTQVFLSANCAGDIANFVPVRQALTSTRPTFSWTGKLPTFITWPARLVTLTFGQLIHALSINRSSSQLPYISQISCQVSFRMLLMIPRAQTYVPKCQSSSIASKNLVQLSRPAEELPSVFFWCDS